MECVCLYFQLWLSLTRNIIIMKNFIAKKKIENQGNSQFTRAKLDSEYNPKYRTSKHPLMSFQKISIKDRHQFKSKEEHQICEKAVQQLKTGSNIVIDWTTKTNFRTTKSVLPKLKTQPSEILHYYPTTPNEQAGNHTPIEQKRIELAKLLHVRHKKHYLKTKREQQEEKTLFGIHNSLEKEVVSKSHQQLSQRKSNERLILSRRKLNNDENIEKVQSKIINGSKLQLLKEQLKAKFVEIREYIYRNGSKHKKKGFFD